MFLLSKGGKKMKIVNANGVVISRGYRLEVSKKHEDELELAFYESGKRKIIDSVPISSVKTYRDAWKFIERHIGSSTNCDFTEEAIKRIFGK